MRDNERTVSGQSDTEALEALRQEYFPGWEEKMAAHDQGSGDPLVLHVFVGTAAVGNIAREVAPPGVVPVIALYD